MKQSIVFAIIIAGIILGNFKWSFDHSVGETHPTFKDKAAYPKFVVHLVFAFAGTILMLVFFVPMIVATGLMLAGIIGYEWSQGFINKLDILAGTIGTIIAVGSWILSTSLI